MIIKIIGAVLLIGASTLVGWHFSHNLINRRDFLKKFTAFLNSLETSMRYNSDDIFTLVTSCAQVNNLDYFEFCNNSNTSFTSQWINKIDHIPKLYSLVKSDKQLLSDFGSQLGKTDVQGQIAHLQLYKTNFTKQLSQAEEDIKQKSKLYKTMGLFAGIATALMII